MCTTHGVTSTSSIHEYIHASEKIVQNETQLPFHDGSNVFFLCLAIHMKTFQVH